MVELETIWFVAIIASVVCATAGLLIMGWFLGRAGSRK